MPAWVTGAVLFAALPASADLCGDIAARLRADTAFTKAGSELQPLDALAKQGFAEVATSSDDNGGGGDNDAYARALAAKYKMDAGLAAKIKDMAFESDEVWSLKANPVHAFSDTGGTAHCATFVFFANGHALPDAPRALDGGMSEDSGGPITECYMSEGNLSRLGTKTAFTATDHDAPRSHDVTLRVAAWDNGKWGGACSVDASFETLYRVNGVFRAKDSPLSQATVARLAFEIARARDRAKDAKKDLAFGPRLPAADKTRLENLAKTLPASQDDIPSFGAKLDQNTNANVGNDMDDVPVAVDGEPYVVRIGHPSIGWRDFMGYALVFYRADGKALTPVASVVLDEEKGRLTKISSGALAE